MVCWHYLKKHVNVTTSFQSLIYLCLVLSGCVKHSRKLLCENSLFWDNKLARYLHHTMTTWGQSEKSIAAWIHHIRIKMIQYPGLPPFLVLHLPPTLEASTRPTKNSCSSKNCTHLDSLLFDLLHNIGIWHADLVHCNKLKPLLERLTQNHPVLRVSTSYKLKYVPFD